MCNGRVPSEKELPLCYNGTDWSDVDLEEFMNCQSNLAINRQTRMMADLTLVNCYDRTTMSESERDKILLQNAKDNLLKMAYFGLTEKQIESQLMFEETFNLKFNMDFVQYDDDLADKTKDTLSEQTVKKIKELNSLDVELYKFALELMNERVEEMKDDDEDFETNLAEAEDNQV